MYQVGWLALVLLLPFLRKILEGMYSGEKAHPCQVGIFIYTHHLMLSCDVNFSLFDLLQIVQNSCRRTVKKQSKTKNMDMIITQNSISLHYWCKGELPKQFSWLLIWHLDPSTDASLSASEAVGKYVQLIDVLEIIGSNMKMIL